MIALRIYMKHRITENSMAITKKEIRHLSIGDILAGSGVKVISAPTAGIKTPTGKVEVGVEYPNGHKMLKIWGKYTVVGVKTPDAIEPPVSNTEVVPPIQEEQNSNELQFKPKYGYWDVTKYPYGGDFKKFDGTETGTLIKGTVKRGDEIRVQLSDGRTIVAPASSVGNMDFESVIDQAKAIGREIV